jgi:triacylglycerol esterase/lipase EstA (alpha/beta hydrolase family)
MSIWCRALIALTFAFAAPLAAVASPHEARIPLNGGKLDSAELSRTLLEDLHIKGVSLDVGSIDLRGWAGATFIRALDASLKDGCNIEVTPDALVLHFDPEKLPHSFDDAKLATRVFTATAAPEATARQHRQYGLLMPQHVDRDRPMVVLVHGLDCDRANWYAMAQLLLDQGYQVAYFTYASDGPLEENAQLLTRDMTALREQFPEMRLDVIAHSMGGLVARRYIEGDDYAGGVDHLVLLGTPNLGTKWASYRIALEIQEHYKLWRHEKDWSPTWMITDGLGEAGRDLKPDSYFLTQLNGRPRRAGVAYTVIAGSQSPVYPISAKALDGVANWIPQRAQTWWGFRQTESALHNKAQRLRAHVGKSDGPVSVKSTKLAGVDDYVVLPCDHASLYLSIGGRTPASWDVIRDRLKR